MPEINPIIRWPGGKSRHLKTLLPLIKPHRVYVEAFAGGLAVLAAKPRSEVEVVNDASGDIVALYRCVRFHFDALLQELEWQLAARRNFADARENQGMTDLQRAARFLHHNMTSFGGSGDGFAVAKAHPCCVARESMLKRLKAMHARLDRVAIECGDWERVVRLYDTPETFFFLDPPYVDSNPRAYEGWGVVEMRHLAEVLPSIKGQWLLTVGDSEEMRRMFAGWKWEAVTTRNSATNQGRRARNMFGELFIQSERALGVS